MEHNLNLKRTDLALELIEDKNVDGIKTKEVIIDDIRITNVLVSRKGSKMINYKPGKYITIEFTDLKNPNLQNIIIKELKKILRIKSKEEHILIIGLGNERSTPDALGPLTINNVIVTNHLYSMGIQDNTYQRVSAFNTNVMGKTGIESSDILTKLVELLKPDKIIVIDSLASSSIERLNKTIQMTDTGIHPGSGIGNKRKEISKDILGIPVIALGVPTVVDAATIVSDTLNFITKHYIYMKNNLNNHKLKLMTKINYLKEDVSLSDEDKKKVLGLIGCLDESDTKKLIYEVLNPIDYNLMVTPKEIDFVIQELSSLLGNSLNKLLHNHIM